MLKEFIQHIQETTQPKIYERGANAFVVTSSGGVSEIRGTIDTPDTLSLNSLDAMVQMVKTEAIGRESGSPLYITIPTHREVRCFAQIDPDKRENRQIYYVAKATDVPGWDDSVKLGFEEAQIALRTRFQHTNEMCIRDRPGIHHNHCCRLCPVRSIYDPALFFACKCSTRFFRLCSGYFCSFCGVVVHQAAFYRHLADLRDNRFIFY